MKTSFAIMAHEKRAHLVADLVPQLPEGTPAIWDDGRLGAWETGRRAWLAHDLESDWHVVLQDDVVLCDGFQAQAARALDELTWSAVASFYMGSGSLLGGAEEVRRAAGHGGRWLDGRGPYWGPAIAVRTGFIAPMLDWCGHAAHEGLAYDYRIARFFTRQLRVLCAYTVPSLVEHRGNVQSVIDPTRPMGRVAALFAQGGCDAWR